jgi:hypothetical protein
VLSHLLPLTSLEEKDLARIPVVTQKKKVENSFANWAQAPDEVDGSPAHKISHEDAMAPWGSRAVSTAGKGWRFGA